MLRSPPALTRWRESLQPSDDPAAVAPVLTMLTAELQRAGMAVRRFRGRVSAGMLYARPKLRDAGWPVQLLVGHCDTVWPVGTLREMPVRLEGDVLRGPAAWLPEASNSVSNTPLPARHGSSALAFVATLIASLAPTVPLKACAAVSLAALT